MGAESTRAELNYIGAGGAAPVTVDIRNGRLASPGRWQDCGFELQQHHSAVTDWDDADEIARVHYDEISALAQQVTGCDVALVGGHIRRNPEQASGVHQQLSPIRLVHSDFAASYLDVIQERYRNPAPETAASMARADIKAEDIERAKRLLVIQFWRNTGAIQDGFSAGLL